MKKILGISLVAVFAVAPLMARAEGLASEPTHATAASDSNTTTAAPQYQVAPADPGTDGNLATAGYVKGAYNAAIRGINKVAADAVQTANLADKSLDIDAKTLKVNGAAVLTGADVANKADKATTLAGYGITDAYTKTEADAAFDTKGAAAAVQTALNTEVTAREALATRVGTAESAIATLNSGVGVEGSVDYKINSAITALDLANSYDQKGAAAAVQTALNTEVTAREALATRVGTAESAIATLNSGVGVEGSVDYKINSAITGLNLGNTYEAKGAVDSALGALDTTESGTGGGVTVTVTQTDGKITGVTASVASQTYDAYGAAAAVETALQSGIVATINASTVPVMTTWGSTAVDTTSLKVQAPAAYVPGAGA